MIADSNGDRSGDTRPLWIIGLSPPASWRSLRQPGYLQLDQVRTPKHCVWGYDRTLKVRNFQSTKMGNFQSQLTRRLEVAQETYQLRLQAGIVTVLGAFLQASGKGQPLRFHLGWQMAAELVEMLFDLIHFGKAASLVKRHHALVACLVEL